MARRAIKSRRHWRAIILHYVDGWPIISNDSKEDTLTKEFGVSKATIVRWLSSGMEAMREALGVAQ